MPKTQIQSSSGKTPQMPSTGVHETARLEFFRHATALMPDPSESFPGYEVSAMHGSPAQRFCACRKSNKKTTCDHLKALSRIGHTFHNRFQPNAADFFAHSAWHRLAAILADGCRETLETIQLMASKPDGTLVVADRSKKPLVVYLSKGEDLFRMMERCTLSSSVAAIPTRADVLRQLTSLTMTRDEMVLRDRGLKTSRQALGKDCRHYRKEAQPDGKHRQGRRSGSDQNFFAAGAYGDDGHARYPQAGHGLTTASIRICC